MGIPGIWQQAEKLEAVSQDVLHKAITGRGAITIGVCPARLGPLHQHRNGQAYDQTACCLRQQRISRYKEDNRGSAWPRSKRIDEPLSERFYGQGAVALQTVWHERGVLLCTGDNPLSV